MISLLKIVSTTVSLTGKIVKKVVIGDGLSDEQKQKALKGLEILVDLGGEAIEHAAEGAMRGAVKEAQK